MMSDMDQPSDDNFKAPGLGADVVEAFIDGSHRPDANTIASFKCVLANDRILFRQLAEPIGVMCEFGFDEVVKRWGHKNAVETSKFLANHAVACYVIRMNEMKGGGRSE
mgnify:CR=1 FL=1